MPQVTPATRGPRSKTILVIVVNVGLILLFFGGLEAALRMRYSKFAGGMHSIQPRALRDPFVFWRNNPDFTSAVVQHNHQGFRRDRDIAVRKPPGTIRIFFLGGSAAYGAEGAYPAVDSAYLRIYNNQLIDYYLEQTLNQAFPSCHWEVINAATMEYRLYQDLALIESTLLRYQPDYVIMMDGYNDALQLINATPNYDYYAATPHFDEFNALANPYGIRSVLFYSSTWLRQNSALFFMIQEHMKTQSHNEQLQSGAKRTVTSPVRLNDLTPSEQARFQVSLSEAGYYAHTARQIHRILDLDGIQHAFLLQPVLVLSHKPLTDAEKRLADFVRAFLGPLSIYEYEQLYPVLSGDLQAAAAKDGFLYRDLTNAFDQTPGQAFTDYCHLTPEANRLISRKIFDLMRSSFAAVASRNVTASVVH